LVWPLAYRFLEISIPELVKLKGNEIIGRQKIGTDIGRLRNVAQGPDGYIYIGVEGKEFLKSPQLVC
jgi:glucose/arabinose dehydrogenase